MNTIDEREMQKTKKEKQTKAERSNGNRSYSERVRAKWILGWFIVQILVFFGTLSVNDKLRDFRKKLQYSKVKTNSCHLKHFQLR